MSSPGLGMVVALLGLLAACNQDGPDDSRRTSRDSASQMATFEVP